MKTPDKAICHIIPGICNLHNSKKFAEIGSAHICDILIITAFHFVGIPPNDDTYYSCLFFYRLDMPVGS